MLIAVSTILLLLAQGYRFDFQKRTVKPTGILVVNSTPDGALIFLNDEAKDATNTSLTSLPPGSYQLRLQKQGYATYQREVQIQKELVTKVEVLLTPLFPELKPLTFTGAQNPVSSPDSSKILFVAPIAQNGKSESSEITLGWWLLELTERPFNLSSSASLLLTDSPALPYSQMAITWSSDSKQVLLEPTAKLQSQNNENPNPSVALAYLLDLTTKKIEAFGKPEEVQNLQKLWQTQSEAAIGKLTESLPESLQQKIAQIKNPIWSPDGSKILYQEIPNNEAFFKVFDLKPKDMFLPTDFLPQPSPKTNETVISAEWEVFKISKERFVKTNWYPDSQHLIILEKESADAPIGIISLVEIDGQNLTKLFSGQIVDDFLAPYPNGSKMAILTNFNPESKQYNLYSVNLR